MYSSSQPPKIYQEEPLYARNSAFKLKGWTETELGYMNEADQLARCILLNSKVMGRKYTWAVSINVEAELSPKDIKDTWTKACRVLRAKGVVALWVREPSLKNHCNYHLIVKNEMTRVALEQAVEEAMPDRAVIPWHKHIRPVRSQYHYARYITKAKTGGYINGKEVKDKYRDKRLLFQAKLGLKKYSTIGKFWEKPKKQLWQDIRDHEQQIADGLEQPKIRLLAQHVYEMIGGYYRLDKIERNFGFFANEPDIQAWADRVACGVKDSTVSVPPPTCCPA
jgi:hypothetical protein